MPFLSVAMYDKWNAMMKMRPLFLALAGLAVNACSIMPEGDSAGAPQRREERLEQSRGFLSGSTTSGINLFGSGGDDGGKSSSGAVLGVNSYLWRATLDTLSFMPLQQADPFGGVIITEWYEDPKTPGERFKVNALILDTGLRADGVKVKLFKQKKQGSGWGDIDVHPDLPRKLEDTILTRARELRVNALARQTQ